MRAFVSGWVGRKTNDKNMTDSGENYANQIIDLFNKTDTLSEFNSATYTGVSVFALTLWSSYLPKESVMSTMGPVMLRKSWADLAQLWHPDMKNLAGPWDRTYGYDMNRYVSVIALWLWAIVGKDASSMISQVSCVFVFTYSRTIVYYAVILTKTLKPHIMSHSPDYAWGPVIAVVADKSAKILPKGFADSLKTFGKERTFKAQAYYPPYDLKVRNITTWLSEKLTIGGATFEQTGLGGPAGTANPAVIQWDTGKEIGFLTVRIFYPLFFIYK